MKSIYFIRHGESVANAGGVTMQHDLIPLSEIGLAQAQTIPDKLKIEPSLILVSNFIRTHQTAKPFCDARQMTYQTEPLLNEFSVLSQELIDGMLGAQRRPIADAYWEESDVNKRMGIQADTFLEFDNRVQAFIVKMASLPNNTLLFGHGFWFALLVWYLMGFLANENAVMKAYKRFQQGLPLNNCIIYALSSGHNLP